MSVQNIIRSWKGQLHITSAVRTPLGRSNGLLKDVLESRLGAIVLDSIFQRSCVDKNDVDHVLLDCKNESIVEMLTSAGLSENSLFSTVSGHSGLKALCSAVQLLSKCSNVVAIAGVRHVSKSSSEKFSFTQGNTNVDFKSDYIQKTETQLLKKQCDHRFLEEIQRIFIPGHPRLNTKEVSLDRDEVELAGTQYSEGMDTRIGAAACILTTKSFNNANISPVANLLGLLEAKSLKAAIQVLLEDNNLNLSEITTWSINADTFCHHINMVQDIKTLGIDEGNIDESSGVIGHFSEIGGLQSLAHLIYSLKPHEKGVLIYSSLDSSISILVEKLPLRFEFICSGKPLLNLYTKVPCPLCDELKVELVPYLDRVQLEEVFLTRGTYLNKLYRYEIPVLFLGGRFVCKNKFDAKVFEKMLIDIELSFK